MKVNISEENYPYFSPVDHKSDYIIDIDENTLNRWKETLAESDKLQREIKYELTKKINDHPFVD